MDEDEYCLEYAFDAGLFNNSPMEDKMDRLEEIRKRDAQEIEAVDMWIHHYTACADRRWLLGEVERLQERIQHKLEEEAAYLDTIRQYAETRDQYAAEVEAQREELGRLRAALEFYADKQNWWQTITI